MHKILLTSLPEAKGNKSNRIRCNYVCLNCGYISFRTIECPICHQILVRKECYYNNNYFKLMD